MTKRLLRRFQFPWRSRTTIARDVDVELEYHIDARVDDLVAAGLSADEARRRAVEEFGDLEYTRRYCAGVDRQIERETRLADRLAAWRQDARYAWRTLRRSPGFTAVTVLTLALAIGANTAIFSVVRAVLLKPLPYGDPGALVSVFSTPTDNLSDHWDLSAPDLVDYRARQHTFTDIAAYYAGRQLATWRPAHADAEIVNAVFATADLFPLYRVRALRGRTFGPGDDKAGAPHVVVLSYGFWQRALGGDTAIVGRALTLYDEPYTVIGVMPRGFSVTGSEDLWLPLDLSGDLANAAVTRKQHVYRAVARLAPGVSVDAARNDLLSIAHQLQREYPEADAAYFTTAVPLHETMAARAQRPLLLLLGAATLILLIACANLANLSLSRAATRSTEFAVRAALGAGRGRLARQLLTESAMLALVGGAIGVGLAVAGTRALLALNPDVLPPLAQVGVDGRVLLFSLALSVGAGIVFGLAPALGAGRADLHGSLKAQGRSGTGTRTHERLRRAFVVAQVALAVVLLVGAGLLVRSFRELTRVHLGFDPDRVLTAQLRVDGARYDSSSAVNRYYDGILADITSAPGVVAAGAAMRLPTQGSMTSTIVVEGVASDPNHPASIAYTIVRGDYFKALRIPIVAGRGFADTDTPNGPSRALINEAAVRAFFPNGNAVGARVHIGPNPNAPWFTIIGVVGDVRNDGLDAPTHPEFYDNGRQATWWRTMTLVVRTAGAPSSVIPLVRRAVKAADPTHAARDFEPLDDVVGASLASRRFALGLASSFAALALVLAAVGIYGVLAYSVASRRREFGVRLALGASRRNVLMLVLRQGLGWSLAGLALGAAAAMAGGRMLSGMLFGVSATDAVTYAAVSAALLAVVAVACFVPARRATRVDPLTSMQAE